MKIIRTAVLADYPVVKWLQVMVYGAIILYFGRDVFIPVSFALLISFVLYPVCTWLEGKGLGRFTSILIAVTILLLIGALLLVLLVTQFLNFMQEWPTFQPRLMETLHKLSVQLEGMFGMPQVQIMKILSNGSGGNIILGIVQGTLSASAYYSVMIFLVPVYSVIILYYRSYWMKLLQRLFPNERNEKLHTIISLTIRAYYNFIKGMAMVYLLVGILNSTGLLLLGVPHAILFGFIASILTFIPYVGIMVGALLPVTISWITHDSMWYPLGIVGMFMFIQYLEANVIFPLAVSNRLNVNPLMMLLSIFIGGILWGMAGMILFVPFVGILKLIADNNPGWKTVSMLLGTEKPSA